MSEAEYAILNFLQSSPGTFFARKEIARRAVKRAVYEGDQHWANNALAALLAQGKIEQNDSGLYRMSGSAGSAV
jgi:hypothetical protein